MKKLLVLLALCMVISVVLVACDTPEEPVEDTTAGTTEAPTTGTEAPSETEAPTTDTEAPTTDTEAPTTDTEAPTTDTESETEPPVVIDPVKVGMSFDQLYTGNGPATAGEENFFAPGSSSSWDGKAVIDDYNVQYVTVWGWVAFFAEIPGTFGYQIGDADPVFDAAFSVDAEQGVIDAATNAGGKSAARMRISIPVEYLAGEEIVIKALAKDAVGTVETLVEFKLTKPVNPNAPAFVLNADTIAAGSTSSEVASVTSNGTYATLVGANDGPHGDAWIMVQNAPIQGAQYVVIKYRTTVDRDGQIFIGSKGGPSGSGDCPNIDYTSDGKWQLAIVDLAQESITSVNKETYEIAYLRYDFFTNGKDDATIDVAYIAAFNSVEAAIAYDANFKGVLVDTLNVPTSEWTVTGHRQGIMDSTDGMVSAGGVEFGALLHQGYIYVGDINLAEMSKVVIYFGIDGSQTTIDRYDASAQNRIILTSADQAMTNSPTEDVVLAANTYSELGWAVHAIEIDLTGVDYNGPVYVTYDTLPGTFMLISSVEFTYDPNYVEPEEPETPDEPEAPVENYNVPMDQWAVTGHAPGITNKDKEGHGPMVAAGGIDNGALLHQGYVGVGEIDLSKYSKVVISYGIDNSQVTIDKYNANANNRVILTNADQAMTMSPADDTIIASNTYTLQGWRLVTIEIDLTGVDYNGPVFLTWDTLGGTFMLIGAIEFVA